MIGDSVFCLHRFTPCPSPYVGPSLFVGFGNNVGKQRMLQPAKQAARVGRSVGSSTLQNLLRAKVWRCWLCVSLARSQSSFFLPSGTASGPCFLVTFLLLLFKERRRHGVDSRYVYVVDKKAPSVSYCSKLHQSGLCGEKSNTSFVFVVPSLA